MRFYSTIMNKTFLNIATACALSLYSFNANAQYDMVSILNNRLISVSGSDGSLNDITALNAPIGNNIESMVYVPNTNLFYTVYSPRLNPLLLSIDLSGNVDTIGTINLPGNTIYMIEGIAYNDDDCGFYISASLDGGPSTGDYLSESILYVDPLTGSARFITEINTTAPKGPDADVIAFWHDTLYIYDDDLYPYTYVYKLTLDSLPAVVSPEEVFYENTYIGVADFAVFKDQLYYSTNNNKASREIYKFNLKQSPLNYNFVGTTHTPSSGTALMGLSDFTQDFFVTRDKLKDTSLCEGELVTLAAPDYASDIIWSTNETTANISIDISDMYWVQYNINLCQNIVDTVWVQFFDCDSCDRKQDSLANLLTLGGDQELCLGNNVTLFFEFNGADEITWNTGEKTDSITVTNFGSYWATLEWQKCLLLTDTVEITFVDCDTCDKFHKSIRSKLSLGGDRIICEGDSLYLTINLDQMENLLWNTGEKTKQIYVNHSGQFWVSFDIGECKLVSDTILISTMKCGNCKYFIPNAFSPNEDKFNNAFRVIYDSTECSPDIVIEIYNRWGEKLYETHENKWNGEVNGILLPLDIYLYIARITYPLSNGRLNQSTEYGTVTLIR